MLANPRNYFLWWGVAGGGGGGIPESWDLESKIPRKIEIRNPSSTDKDLESSTEYRWNSESTEWNPEYKTSLDPLPNGINRRSYQQ